MFSVISTFYGRYAPAAVGFTLFLAGTPVCAGPRMERRSFTMPHSAVRPEQRKTPPANGSDPNAQSLLQRMLEAESTLALSGDQVTTVARGGLDVSSEQQVQRDGARSLRIDYVRPARLAGDEIIDNGTNYCRYHASQDTLEISPSKIGRLRVHIPQVLKQLQSGRLIASLGGQDTVAEHSCTVVQVAESSAPATPWRRFWIDPTNGAQLRIQVYDATGNLQSDSYYTQVNYNPNFDPGTFRIPHTGNKVVAPPGNGSALTLDQLRQKIGFALLAPSYLPNGFQFQSGSVTQFRERTIAGLRYFNGVTILSLFETPDTPAGADSRVEHPRRGVLLSHQAGLKIILVGNLADPEMQRVLASMH